MFIGAICVGLGFAGLENLFWIVGQEDWQTIGAGRALSAVPAHAILGMVLGFFASKAFKHPEARKIFLAKGLVTAIVFHGLYDFPLFAIHYLKTENGHSVVGVFYLTLFVVVLLVQGVIGIRCMEAVLVDGDGVDSTEEATSRLSGFLVSQGACKTFGTILVLFGVAAIAFPLYASDETQLPNYALFPFSIFPIIFGYSMVRFGYRR